MSDTSTFRPVAPYAPLPPIKGEKLKFTLSDPFVPTFLQSALPPSVRDPAQVYASGVKGKQILLENPARESRTKKLNDEKKVRRAKHEERKRTGVLGRTAAKRMGLWNLERDVVKYDTFLPIHHLWLGYMAELLDLAPPPDHDPTRNNNASTIPKLPNAANMHPKLVKADFHGSILTVRRSKNPSLVGCCGIVIHETENTFKLVTRADKLKVIPKQNSVFAFSIPLYAPAPASSLPFPEATPQTQTRDHDHDRVSINTPATTTTSASTSVPTPALELTPSIEFELYGNQFRFRATDRANRKFKAKETIEL
ncbi:hypothetical protein BOTBODRAFT_170408 [Botryobasidium botryosum FD-172 SS1]|uniref:Uncharacterized protein n=1 Tax=Botryobasidium botryosum (strain FD-172 SS1) TaxID=930990 RepID=A0A067N598_BOTB1|nr:hypothetical protein BOTBODRAFT_170408 [Botryobasidium botryosum FD-172 SS1]